MGKEKIMAKYEMLVIEEKIRLKKKEKIEIVCKKAWFLLVIDLDKERNRRRWHKGGGKRIR